MNEVSDNGDFNDGTTITTQTVASDLTNDAGYLTSIGSIGSHTDVVVSSPQNDQILKYNGSQWVNTTFSTTAQVVVQDAAPSNPQPGDMWWKSDEGTLKIYYSDVDTNQWVDASPIGDPFENTYASIAFFPQANVSEGAFAFSEATDAMYYSNGTSWTDHKLLLQTVLPSRLSTLLTTPQLHFMQLITLLWNNSIQ